MTGLSTYQALELVERRMVRRARLHNTFWVAVLLVVFWAAPFLVFALARVIAP